MSLTPAQVKGRIKSIAAKSNADARLLMRIYMMDSPGEGIIKDVVFFIAEAAPGQMINQESEVTYLEWLPYEAAYLTLTHQSDRETLQKAWEYLNRQAVSEADKETRNDS